MKKTFLKIAAACCIISLSACSVKKNDSVTKPDGKLDKCSLRFSWWGGDDRHEATLKAIDLWNKKYPDITITPEYGGWDGWSEKVTSQVSSSTEPDIMQINYDWLIALSPDGNGFYDLGELSSQLDLSQFDDEVLSFGKVGEKLNAVTVSVSGRSLFYNSQVFSRMGADYPETWNDLIALGNRFSEDGLYPLDLDIQSGGTAWYLAVVYVQQQTGRQFITLDGRLGFTVEDIKNALSFYKQLEESHVIRTVRTRTDEDGNAALYQSPEFIGGRVAGVLEWGSAVGKYESVLPEGVLEAGPLLTDEKGCSDGWMIKPSLLYAISKNTKHPDEAAAFINFLLNDEECAEILGTTRGIPASHKAEAVLQKSGALNGLTKESESILSNAHTVTISPYMELSRMKEFYNTAIEAVSYGTSDVDSAAQQMFDSVNNYLEKIRK
ncbi:ABC transporter substrate-binding protein [Ruminococcus flavefaciens]|uniref:ABC transporter substrate-binding protein n=1 Tax=Ruminococcus flavefaciens TaxID=1265 RepID=UPI00048BB447|nr:ABC transporter substrate-binding protein [Ruminococcus flavefaciens]